MIVITAGSANELYSAACRAVHRGGRPANPRGLATREVLGAHLCLTDPRRRLVDLPPIRRLNPAFAVAEAVWILSGSDEDWIFDYNRNLHAYTDHGRLQGAYGPRMRRWRDQVDQLDHVRRLLSADPDSRQAVIQLYDPALDARGHRDVPCTLNYRFFLRGGALHMHTTMRSQDLWLGFPYDLYTATVLQELLAGWLEVEPGAYHHHVDSLHLYAEHLPVAAEMPLLPPASVRMPALACAWEDFDPLLSAVLAGHPPRSAGQVWTGLAQVMASYRAWTAGDRGLAHGLAARIDGELGRVLRSWYQHLTKPASAVVTG